MSERDASHVPEVQPLRGNRVALYARTTCRDSGTHEEEMRRLCGKRGWDIVRVIHETDNHPRGVGELFQTLLRDSFYPKMDVVLVWKFSRVSTETAGLLMVEEELRLRGVGLASYRERFDHTTVYGKAVFGILAAVAEFEQDMEDRELL